MFNKLKQPVMMFAILAFVMAAVPLGSVQAQAQGRQFAVLVAVRDHVDDRFDLQFTLRDVQSMRTTLMERAGIPTSHILEVSDLASDTRRPSRDNIKREVPEFLKQVKPEDRLIVFYSGHGVVNGDQVCLVPSDFDRERVDSTSLPIAWLQQQLAACPAQSKFLILDACHSGGAKNADEQVSSQQLAKAVEVETISGCVVLASCRSDELSYEWKDRRQGLFTYWLCRGLEGGADEDADGKLTADEVYQFAFDRVTKTAQQVFKRPQTPVRRINEDITGDPVLLTLRPEPPESLCRRLAGQLDLEIRSRGLKNVGVLEFMAPVGNVAGGLVQANFPRYCTSEVQASLSDLSGDQYRVLDDATMGQASKGVRVEEVGDPISMRRLSERAGGLDAVIIGTLRKRGRKLHVQCELISTSDGNTLIAPTGVLPLSEDLLGDIGGSFDNRDNDQSEVFRPDTPFDPDRVDLVLEAMHEGHPLKRRDFPFEIEIHSIAADFNDVITTSTPRKQKEWLSVANTGSDDSRRDDIYVTARNGEIFEIRLKNKLRERVGLALLVDGINSLGQQRERLRDARLWILDPNQDYVVGGWYTTEDSRRSRGGTKDYTLKRFVFTDVAQSVAGRQQFGDSIGVITLAFFKEGTGRDLAVGEAQIEQRTLKPTTFKRSHLLAVVQVRYVDERDLK